MKTILIKGISSLLAITLLFTIGGIALARIIEYSPFAEYEISHFDSNTANDTATGTVTLLHQDGNDKYWGYVRAKIEITGLEKDGQKTWTVSDYTDQLETHTVTKTVTGKNAYGRSTTAILTARCRHEEACVEKGEAKQILKETW